MITDHALDLIRLSVRINLERMLENYRLARAGERVNYGLRGLSEVVEPSEEPNADEIYGEVEGYLGEDRGEVYERAGPEPGRDQEVRYPTGAE